MLCAYFKDSGFNVFCILSSAGEGVSPRRDGGGGCLHLVGGMYRLKRSPPPSRWIGTPPPAGDSISSIHPTHIPKHSF